MTLVVTAVAQTKSPKRGISWDEKNVALTPDNLSKMSPGISWLYNWGIRPSSEALSSGDGSEIAYVPMCWNGSFNETELRQWLTAHPETKYLLGFNEPNLSWNVGGSQMTSQQAATAWPRLEQIADEFGLELVAPALNYSGDVVGGRIYNTPFDWLEEFVRLYPTARMDYLCLHCYMDYASAVKWFATEYFYGTGDGDLYGASNRTKYPNLIQYFETYGQKKMFLTEFSAYGSDLQGNHVTLTQDVQIDQMTQKIQYLEQSDKVAGYAWFIGNGNASVAPYNSLFETATPTSQLSRLGKVYVYMSSFDTENYFSADADIPAKDYVDASTDDQQVKLRPNSETATADELPLQVEYLPNAWASYQIDVPSAGDYTLTMHLNTTEDKAVWLYVDKKRTLTASLSSTAGVWEDRPVTITLPEGRHTLMVFNPTQSSFLLNKLSFAPVIADGISHAVTDENATTTYFRLDGTAVANPLHGVFIQRTVGRDGRVTTKKIIR